MNSQTDTEKQAKIWEPFWEVYMYERDDTRVKLMLKLI